MKIMQKIIFINLLRICANVEVGLWSAVSSEDKGTSKWGGSGQ